MFERTQLHKSISLKNILEKIAMESSEIPKYSHPGKNDNSYKLFRTRIINEN